MFEPDFLVGRLIENLQEKKKGRTEKVVCVTGASGYVASWLVKHLLRHGYAVKATVRDPNDLKKTEHLRGLDGASERLELFRADLLEDGSFDSAVDGCEGVFHTASPVPTFPISDKSEVIDPAVIGTLNVLKSCAKVGTIKRVVLTSSIASIMYVEKPLTSDMVIDESWSSEAAFCEDQKLWYILSKILSEEAACRFAEENGTDLVSINPGFVIGPVLNPAASSTSQMLLDLINGNSKMSFSNFTLVDVRDVADAHIKAFEASSASGRHCLVAGVLDPSELPKILKKLFPGLRVYEKSEGEEEASAAEPLFQVSKTKAESLGIVFMDLEVSLRDTIESFVEKGLLRI